MNTLMGVATVLYHEGKPIDLRTPHVNLDLVISDECIHIKVREPKTSKVMICEVKIVLTDRDRKDGKADLQVWLYDKNQIHGNPPLIPQVIRLATARDIEKAETSSMYIDELKENRLRHLLPEAIGYALESSNYAAEAIVSEFELADCLYEYIRDGSPGVSQEFVEQAEMLVNGILPKEQEKPDVDQHPGRRSKPSHRRTKGGKAR